MAAHAADLRVEVDRERTRRPAAGAPATGAPATGAPSGPRGAPDEVDGRDELPGGLADDIAAQGSEAAPTDRLRALLQFAERLALAPGLTDESHLLPLRAAGLDDVAIHDAAQAVAYFSYINRIADGLGVDLEPGMEDPEARPGPGPGGDGGGVGDA